MIDKITNLKVTEHQLDVIGEALEFYSRFLCGDVLALPKTLNSFRCCNNLTGISVEATKEYKKELFPELSLNGSHSIQACKMVEAKMAYDMYRELLTKQAKATGNTASVYFDESKITNTPKIL